jgi:hypothetical protein
VPLQHPLLATPSSQAVAVVMMMMMPPPGPPAPRTYACMHIDVTHTHTHRHHLSVGQRPSPRLMDGGWPDGGCTAYLFQSAPSPAPKRSGATQPAGGCGTP